MCKDEFTRNAAPDGIHDNINFNEYRSAEYRANVRARKARRDYIMEKLAPYIIVVGAMFAFLAIGVMECGL
ncbi:MAG: hypothetical protein IKB97_06000 [Bacteroidaceae bacterium]|nr:hypothetical protein [Fibrobacter sp.]MBR2863092.1 hypothetical protein [Bacteroidaceae bacterium]MBR6317194.1 hypothetical protein [Fibrobacter sp.]